MILKHSTIISKNKIMTKYNEIPLEAKNFSNNKSIISLMNRYSQVNYGYSYCNHGNIIEMKNYQTFDTFPISFANKISIDGFDVNYLFPIQNGWEIFINQPFYPEISNKQPLIIININYGNKSKNENILRFFYIDYPLIINDMYSIYKNQQNEYDQLNYKKYFHFISKDNKFELLESSRNKLITEYLKIDSNFEESFQGKSVIKTAQHINPNQTISFPSIALNPWLKNNVFCDVFTNDKEFNHLKSYNDPDFVIWQNLNTPFNKSKLKNDFSYDFISISDLKLIPGLPFAFASSISLNSNNYVNWIFPINKPWSSFVFTDNKIQKKLNRKAILAIFSVNIIDFLETFYFKNYQYFNQFYEEYLLKSYKFDKYFDGSISSANYIKEIIFNNATDLNLNVRQKLKTIEYKKQFNLF